MIDPDVLSPEKRAQILHGAAIVFGSDGYEGASMSRIAKEANVSKGTLYNHFASKADLFSAHLGEACHKYFSHVFEGLNETEDLETALGGIARRMVGILLTPERRSLYRMVASEAESFPELAQEFYRVGPRTAVATLSAWIASQVAQGKLVVPDCEFAAEQFFALCQTRLAMRYQLFLQDRPSEAEMTLVANGAVAAFLALYRSRT